MKTTAIAALSSLVLSLVAAAPLNKREVVWVTSTEVLVETVLTTTTVWVDQTPSTAAPASTTTVGGEFYEKAHDSPSFAPAIAAPSSSVAPVVESSAPVASAALVPTSSPAPAAAPETLSSVYVAPAPPTSTYVAPVSPSTYGPPAAARTPQAAAPSFSGDMTYYDVGMGSCGWNSSPGEDVVAIDTRIMANGINPNHNPLCGKSISIKYGGNTHSAKIVDTCGGCNPNSIDVPEQLFKKIAPNGDGRVNGVEWWIN